MKEIKVKSCERCPFLFYGGWEGETAHCAAHEGKEIMKGFRNMSEKLPTYRPDWCPLFKEDILVKFQTGFLEAPDWITKLKKNEIFVFGSNLAGIHGAGAAKQAVEWGAVKGVGIGFSGNTYAIPTKDEYFRVLSLDYIKSCVSSFLEDAKIYRHYDFLVTEIGCGLAGYQPSQIAPFFEGARESNNVFLPKSFIQILNKQK